MNRVIRRFQRYIIYFLYRASHSVQNTANVMVHRYYFKTLLDHHFSLWGLPKLLIFTSFCFCYFQTSLPLVHVFELQYFNFSLKLRSNKADQKSGKTSALRIIVVSVLLGFGWVFAIPLTFTDDATTNVVFGWLFSLTNAFQVRLLSIANFCNYPN